MNRPVLSRKTENSLILDFSLPSALWNEIAGDNVSIMVSDRRLAIFSFSTGTMLAAGAIDDSSLQQLRSSKNLILNRNTNSSATIEEELLFKFEHIDLTGLFSQGIIAQATGDIAGAIISYQKVIEADPEIGRAYNLLGLCLRLDNDTIAAENAYRKAIEIFSEGPEAWCNLGILYQKTGREEEAQKCFKAALERDEFYFNALQKRATWLLETGQVANPEFTNLNLRLLMHYSELAAVQRFLTSSAGRLDMSIEQYCEQLHSEQGILANAKVQKYFRQIEGFINNGAFAQAAGYMQMLKEMTPEMHGEKQVNHWLKLRANKIIRHFSADSNYEFIAKVRSLVEVAETPANSNERAPLTGPEFFSMVLLEIIRDGQIEPAEQELIKKLKTALHVPDDLFMKMFNNVRRQLAGVELSGGLRERFSHQRLFRNLCRAACRDGMIEESEKKILGFACRAFGISSEEFKKIITEVAR